MSFKSDEEVFTKIFTHTQIGCVEALKNNTFDGQLVNPILGYEPVLTVYITQMLNKIIHSTDKFMDSWQNRNTDDQYKPEERTIYVICRIL